MKCFQVVRERNQLICQSFKQLNTHFNRRNNTSSPPLAVHRVKVTFTDEPGEGSGVARSFYTAIANVHDSVFCELSYFGPLLPFIFIGYQIYWLVSGAEIQSQSNGKYAYNFQNFVKKFA